MPAILEQDHQAANRRLTPCVEKATDRLDAETVFCEARGPAKSLIDHLSTGDSLEIPLGDLPALARGRVRAAQVMAGL